MNTIKKVVYIKLLIVSLFLIYIITPTSALDTAIKTQTFKTDGKYWIIYDNICPYCKSAAKQIKQLDWEGQFKFISYRDPLTYEMFPSLTKEECQKDVHMVTPKGEVLIGYQVFRTIIDNLTATKILNPILHNDYAEKKLNEIYEKMVKERSCYYKKSGTCSLKQH